VHTFNEGVFKVEEQAHSGGVINLSADLRNIKLFEEVFAYGEESIISILKSLLYTQRGLKFSISISCVLEKIKNGGQLERTFFTPNVRLTNEIFIKQLYLIIYIKTSNII